MKPAAFFFDIDGTLRSRQDYTIPQSAIAAIAALKARGYPLYIASGRGLYSCRNMGRYVGIDNMVSDGGRIVYEDGRIVYHHPMPLDLVEAWTALAKKLNFPLGYSNEFAIHSTCTCFSKAFDLDETILCSVKRHIDYHQLGPINKLYVYYDYRKKEDLIYLKEHEHHWLRDQLCVIEQERKDEGIAVLMARHQWERASVVCFGDDDNDISMFDLCGISVCMGNGSANAKKHATYITADLDRDGIYQACRHFGWI